MLKTTNVLLVIIAFSCVVQFGAAWLALRLVRPSGALLAWLLLAAAFTVQGVRRILVLAEVVAGHYQETLLIESVGLVVSLLMFFGILKIESLFSELQGSRQNLALEQEKLAAAYDELETAQQRLKESNRQLALLATIDGLTGLRNRREFEQKLSSLWKSASRDGQTLAILMADIDHFKSYNDSYGHLAGDDCLRRVAQIVKQSCLRPGDFVARYGGEEFVALLPETGLKDARQVAERIRINLQQEQIPHARSAEGVVTLSIGVCSVLPDSSSSEWQLVACADRCLYAAKNSGRNRVSTTGRDPLAGENQG